MPLYVRAGSIVPMGPALQHTAETAEGPIELRIYPGRDAAFTLYADDGESYAYEQGAFSELPMTWNEEARTLTLHARRGSERMVGSPQQFRVVLVESGRGTGGGETTRADRIVRYRGAELRVRLE
jgi:alpha-D-xyloside xylohydrolase